MKKLITTLKNIWNIKDLRERILFTLFILMVYRFGCYVVLPGVDAGELARQTADSGGQGLIGLINAFSGGAFLGAAVFALGIMPYITASIIIQLLGFAVPYFQRLQQREGESGRKKLTQITRWLTVAITLVQGSGYLTYIVANGALAPAMEGSKTLFYFANLIILSTGTIFAMWLGERITDKGIGNGISLLITVGIIATLPGAFITEVTKQLSAPLVLVIEMALLFFVVLATILVVQGVRRIPIQFAKRMVGRSSTAMPAQGVRDYIPLKVNAAGVMPIIFAQALMFLPATVAQFAVGAENASQSNFLNAMNDFTSWQYNVVYFFLVVIFTYVYTALLVNPTQYAEYLKRQNSFIPGIKPGKNTADFIDSVTTRITLPGSIFLGLISILPAFAARLGVEISFAMFFGGTSLLILVAVVLDTLQQIDSHLLMRKYDGLVKSGRGQGRSRVQGIGASM